ncbi:ERG8, Phosphomevalonate kinase [Aureobasidium subglaciale]|nr:ERG8, Phosphomevalonate kinase [Aureobasidium subglaciale]
MSQSAVAVSAPGKVLLAGGYLVLDRKYNGLVFGLDARIHVSVKPFASSSGVTFSEITVKSPQFQDAVWEYGYRLAEKDGGVKVTQLRVDADFKLNRNPFVETALAYALSYISSVGSSNISPSSITILADNDYYSTSSASLTGARFHDFGVPLAKANKTGLGSSAALVTSFTAAVLSYYLPKETFDLTTESGKRKLHNLAQAAHCAAQGKVGSGFDVASAVYGSCLYRRFSPTILSAHGEPGTPEFGKQLVDIVDESGASDKWDTEIVKDQVKVPRGIRLVMCDVSCGSQTPGMVKQVLAWRKDSGAAGEKVWEGLQKVNEGLSQELVKLAESGSKDYSELKQRILAIRQGIREMSEQSGVPIEPPAQTELLNACSKVEGVVGGVVPGAGGYDAVALLIEDREEVVQKLQQLLSTWQIEGETDGGMGKVSMLRVKQEMEGVRVEQSGDYAEWSE